MRIGNGGAWLGILVGTIAIVGFATSVTPPAAGGASVAPPPASTLSAATAHAAGATPLTPNANWAGWTQVGSPGEYDQVWGEWQVDPLTTPYQKSSMAADWVGVGGFSRAGQSNTAFVQLGTDSYTVDGKPYYVAVYDLAPAKQQRFPCPQCKGTGGYFPPLSPNQKVAANIFLVDGSDPGKGLWQLEFTNRSTGLNVIKLFTATTTGNSVEAIHERVCTNFPTCTKFYPYPKTVGFQFDCLAYGAGTSPNLQWFGTPAANATYVRSYISDDPKGKGTAPESGSVTVPSDLNLGAYQNKFNLADNWNLFKSGAPDAPNMPDTNATCGF